MKNLVALLTAAACVFFLTACTESSQVSGESSQEASVEESQEAAEESRDTIFIGVTSIVSALNPTDSTVPWSLTSHGVSETLYKQDENGELVSRFVDTLTQTDELTWEMTLKEGLKFSDGSDIDAQAVCDCMNNIMQQNVMATASAGVIEFTAEGTDMVRMVTERETKIMPSVLAEWTNILYKDLGNGEYAFTGPYMIQNLDVGVSLEMIPNPYYDDQAEDRSNVTLMVFQDTSSMQQAFEGGEIDMAFTVTPETAENLESKGYTVKSIDAGYQYFAIVNLQNAPLDDLNVREAVNQALNREDMVTALRGGQAATGCFAHYYSFAGECEVVYDPQGAADLLEESGWVLNSEGIREKDGQTLTLNLKTYASRPDLTVIMQLAASQLSDIGIDVQTEIVDNIDNVGQSGDYDIIFYAQHSAPTGEPAYFLNQFFREGEGKNFNGYSSEEMDAILNEMGTLEFGEERDQLAKDAQELIFEDLPILYLVDPQWHIAVSDKLSDYQPYCGDYYVVNDQLGL